jgi:N-acyl-D-amino-acid deacylase
MRYVTLLLLVLGISCTKQQYDVVIRGATVMDGSGAAGQIMDVAIQADTIAFVGDLSSAIGKEEIQGKGLVLAPGFIDTHSHHDRGLKENPDVLAAISQGITTIVVGQDGSSHWPLKDFFQSLQANPPSVNVASYSGHNTLRDVVLGSNFKREASQSEIDSMKTMLQADMQAGAIGLSTGLEYDPGIYSARDEVLQLAKVLPQHNGRYISHLRSEDRFFWDALDEIITIGRETKVPVQVSHMKLAMRGLWGKADSALQILNKAREQGINISADVYPYPYWSSTITVLFPNRNFTDEREAAFILKEVTTPEGIIFSNHEPNPEYNGKSLADVATLLKLSPEKTLIKLIQDLALCQKTNPDCGSSIVATSMTEPDIQKIMQWPNTSICSDGASSGRHPRGFGAFTRVLGKYVRSDSALSLASAIHKMTTLSANQMNIQKRGAIKPGYYADLVLFDAATVSDQSTIQQPQQISTGIQRVWVNGQTAFVDEKVTGKRSGRVVRRSTGELN